MTSHQIKSRKPKKLGPIRRRAVTSDASEIVGMRPLFSDQSLPLLAEPKRFGVDLLGWAVQNRSTIEDRLLQHGGILFRGFRLDGPSQLEPFIEAVAGKALEYKERSSPRSSVSGNIYTSTDYPPSYPIFLHNENSYQNTWPMKIAFFAQQVSETGGETPIADCRRVYENISPEIRERFASLGWMVVRNFSKGAGLPWQEVFQTEDRQAVEAHCAAGGIEVEWKPDDKLRTRVVRAAVAKHPKTEDSIWFNHATFFHVSTLVEDVRRVLQEQFAEEDLPSNSYYGDGTSIEADVLEHLREAYNRATVRFPWQEGDLLLLDNMLVAHGRNPFTGKRKILVGMSEPMSRSQLNT